MILCMFGSPFLMTFAVSIAIHMRRIEGRFPALALTQLSLGVVNVVAMFVFVFLCQVATFRVDRAPELIQLLNDMAWIPFIGIGSPVMVAMICFSVAILVDKRARPIFPRWLGYFNLWVALILAAGSVQRLFPEQSVALGTGSLRFTSHWRLRARGLWSTRSISKGCRHNGGRAALVDRREGG